MRPMLKKLRGTAGDTMVEVLVAILIAALGAALLATMVMTSTNVVSTSKKEINKTYAAANAIAQNALTDSGEVTISGGGMGGTYDIVVSISESESPDMQNYRPKPVSWLPDDEPGITGEVSA